MSLDEGVSRFIGRLYKSVYDADAWRTVMHEMMSRTGSRLAFVTYADVRRKNFLDPSSTALRIAGSARRR